MRRTNPGPAMRHIGRLVAERTDSGRLVRGHEIFEDELIGELSIDGDRVSGEVVGTRQWPYEVTMRLPRGADGSLPGDPWKLRFDCTCPDVGDPCKHGVALALAVAARIDAGTYPGVAATGEDTASTLTERSRLDILSAGDRPASRPPAVPVPVPHVRPSWAEELPDRPPPTTLADWFGTDQPPETHPLDFSDVDAVELILDLGPCEVPGGGPNLATAIQLLVLRLLGGPDPH